MRAKYKSIRIGITSSKIKQVDCGLVLTPSFPTPYSPLGDFSFIVRRY
jgi:hypothetical protein